MLSGIYGYPTAILVDRSGDVRSIHTGFAGPATGRHHDEYVREFRDEVERLLAKQVSRESDRETPGNMKPMRSVLAYLARGPRARRGGAARCRRARIRARPRVAVINVLIIDETGAAGRRACSTDYGIASRVSTINKGAHADALREVLRDQNIRMRLATPTACPNLSTRDACASVRRIKDVDLPNAIAEAKGSTLLVLWPEAAYFPQEQLYLAYVDVDVIEKGKARPGPFYLGYHDWECTAECVPTAFEASAKEISAMVRYMLDWADAVRPASWQSKPLVTTVDKWATPARRSSRTIASSANTASGSG